MKKLILILTIAIISISFFTENVNAQNTSEVRSENFSEATIAVSGTCNMCKKRIEKAGNKIKGVKSAEWNLETQILKIVFDDSKISKEKIAKKIAFAGHDTELILTKDAIYNDLHKCCKYDRVLTIEEKKNE